MQVIKTFKTNSSTLVVEYNGRKDWSVVEYKDNAKPFDNYGAGESWGVFDTERKALNRFKKILKGGGYTE